MRWKFCFQMANMNLVKNHKSFVPFLIACIGTIFTFVVYSSVSYNTGTDALPINSSFLQFFFQLGKIVIIIFSVFFLLYAANYLMKNRVKELGLYTLMGMEKKHISIILFFEIMLIYIITLACASLFAFVLGKLVFRFFIWLMNVRGSSEFIIPLQSLKETAIIYLFIYLAMYLLYNIILWRMPVIKLIKSADEGEKEPKNRKIIGWSGLVLLGFGYFYAASATNLADFILLVPVILFATYLIFSSGSILILKKIMHSKKFYKPTFFISVTNLMFRMKKNAVSLANLCILSTGVILVLTIACSVYAGKNDMLRNRFPFDVGITGQDVRQYEDIVEKAANRKDITIDEKYFYRAIHVAADIVQDKVTEAMDWSANSYNVYLISEDDYIQSGGEHKLSGNTLLIYDTSQSFLGKKLSINNKEYLVEQASSLPFLKNSALNQRRLYIIAGDPQSVSDSFTNKQLTEYLFYMISGEPNNRISFSEAVLSLKAENISIYSFDTEAKTWYEYFGGGMFLCVFMGILFMMFLVLIMYFKQISEGNEDRKQFLILKNIGLSTEEINTVIKTQIRIMFFLPLIMAALHMIAAANVISKALASFYLEDTQIILLSMGIILLIFFVIYHIVYKSTAHVYLKLIDTLNG